MDEVDLALAAFFDIFSALLEANPGTYLTQLGNLILEQDSYFEDIFTIWLLHLELLFHKESLQSDFLLLFHLFPFYLLIFLSYFVSQLLINKFKWDVRKANY